MKALLTVTPDHAGRDARTPSTQEARMSVPDLRELLAGISHDLRTPLNTILGFSEILLSRRIGPLNAQQEKEIQIILKKGSELLGILDQLVDYAKVSGRDRPFRETPLVLASFVKAATEDLGGSLSEEGVAFTCTPPSGSCRVQGDPARLRQVLNHVLEAGRYLVEARRITIATRMPGEGKEALPAHRVLVEVGFAGPVRVKADSLFSWEAGDHVSGLVRFRMHLSRFYMTLMGGDLSVRQTRGRVVFQLQLRKEES